MTGSVGEVEGLDVTPEDAQRIVEQDREDRIKAVERGISDLCTHHRCALDIQFTFSTLRQPVGRVVVVPRD
jgi:hypothetical protein